MAIPSSLVENHHSVSIGGGVALLSLDGHDYFPPGEEPQLSHRQAFDNHDIAGRSTGLMFPRGNVRWTASLTRVREFIEFTYPYSGGGITAATPEEHAQKWLIDHLDALTAVNSNFTWNGRDFGASSVIPNGTTDGPFAIVSYQIEMVEAVAE
ncbi:MAG: hypothetical protein V4726_07360 [Verrucomicrobiota bacterium]